MKMENLQECMAKNPDMKTSLESLLIMPVQRIPRYEMLLKVQKRMKGKKKKQSS
jgi:hypothetical protein